MSLRTMVYVKRSYQKLLTFEDAKKYDKKSFLGEKITYSSKFGF